VTPAEIEMLEALLAHAKTANDTSVAISENRRGETDDGNRKEAVMRKVSTPYKNRNKWRVRVTDTESGGTLLDITDAKTEAGERTLKLPEKLRPLLAKLTESRTRSWRASLASAGCYWPRPWATSRNDNDGALRRTSSGRERCD
jgi:hypothetical protein